MKVQGMSNVKVYPVRTMNVNFSILLKLFIPTVTKIFLLD